MDTTFSQLRGNLKSYCDKAVANRETIRVRRRNGRDVVLLAADEYDSLADTAHLLSSPRNAARLLGAHIPSPNSVSTQSVVMTRTFSWSVAARARPCAASVRFTSARQ